MFMVKLFTFLLLRYGNLILRLVMLVGREDAFTNSGGK